MPVPIPGSAAYACKWRVLNVLRFPIDSPACRAYLCCLWLGAYGENSIHLYDSLCGSNEPPAVVQRYWGVTWAGMEEHVNRSGTDVCPGGSK